MEYPLRQDYNLAVQNLSRFVTDPRFRNGRVRKTKNQRLIAYSGGYSLVYPIDVAGKTVALRCWAQDIGRAGERYAKISAHLRTLNLPYFVDFDFIDRGIVVNGRTWPIMYMEWAAGMPLYQFLDQNINNRTLLHKTATEFQQMVVTLHQHNIAHGDLQDGNIIVQQRGNDIELKLINYDSVFVPTLQGWPNVIAGVDSYQHLQRKAAKITSPKIDYFSELVIYLSLCAYQERPALWQAEQEQQLLFETKDYLNPTQSARFRTLKGMSPQVRQLTEQLERFCTSRTIDQLSPLERILPSGTSTSYRPSQSAPVGQVPDLTGFFNTHPATSSQATHLVSTSSSSSPTPLSRSSLDLGRVFEAKSKSTQPSKPASPPVHSSPPKPSQQSSASGWFWIVVMGIVLALFLVLYGSPP